MEPMQNREKMKIKGYVKNIDKRKKHQDVERIFVLLDDEETIIEFSDSDGPTNEIQTTKNRKKWKSIINDKEHYIDTFAGVL